MNNPPFTSSLKIEVDGNMPAGTYVVSIVGQGGNLTEAATYVLRVEAKEPWETIIGILTLIIIFAVIMLIRRFMSEHGAR